MNYPGKQPQSRDTRHIQKPLDIHTTECNPNKDILTTIIGLDFPPLTLLSYPQELPIGKPYYLATPTRSDIIYKYRYKPRDRPNIHIHTTPRNFHRKERNRTFKHIHLI